MVYIVDDDPAIQQALGRLMRSAGLRAETFAAVRALLDRYSKGHRAVTLALGQVTTATVLFACVWALRYPIPTRSYPDYFTFVTPDFRQRPIYQFLQAYARGEAVELP